MQTIEATRLVIIIIIIIITQFNPTKVNYCIKCMIVRSILLGLIHPFISM
jgi:hypothetical protein